MKWKVFYRRPRLSRFWVKPWIAQREGEQERKFHTHRQALEFALERADADAFLRMMEAA